MKSVSLDLVYCAQPSSPQKDPFFVWPKIIDSFVTDLIGRKCCLAIGPPGGGTSSALLAAESAYLERVPSGKWWTIDVKRLITTDTVEFYQSLGVVGSRLFGCAASHWADVLDDRSFCRSLIKTSMIARTPLVIAVDHIEQAPREIARTLVRGVRSLYTNWNEQRYGPRPISVGLAGSYGLYRQAAAFGSPLNFAVSHQIADLTVAETCQLIKAIGEAIGLTFDQQAVNYLAEVTSGDKQLVRRLVRGCFEEAQRNDSDGRLPVDLARHVVDEYLESGYHQDAQLAQFPATFLRYERAAELFLPFLEDTSAGRDYVELIAEDFPPEIKRLFKVVDNRIYLRSPFYRELLLRHAEVLRATLAVQRQHDLRIERIDHLRRLLSQIEMLSGVAKPLEELLSQIGRFFDCEDGVHLLRLDASNRGYTLVQSSAVGLVRNTTLPDRNSDLRKRLCVSSEAVPCDTQDYCVQCLGRLGNQCQWLPLNLEAQNKQIGILILRGIGWQSTHSEQRELSEIQYALASALQRWQRLEGLSELAGLTVHTSNDLQVLNELCRAGTKIFNAVAVGLWIGQAETGHLVLRACHPDTHFLARVVSKIPAGVGDASRVFATGPQAMSTAEASRLQSGRDRLASKAIEAWIGVSLTCPDGQPGLLAIALPYKWQPSDADNTMANLLRERAIAMLSNLLYLNEAELSIQSNRSAIHILSHELPRHPARIGRQVEAILAGKYGQVPSGLVTPLNRILQAKEVHDLLVQRLLDVTRLDAGKRVADVLEQPILPIVELTLRELAGEITDAGMSLQVNESIGNQVVSVDEVLLRLALEALVHNAIQYAKRGVVSIQMTSTQAALEIAVADQGPGVAPEYRHGIFQRFNRGTFNESREAREGNLGLGLFFVRQIMELHQGSVWYDDSYQDGARFVLRLPLNTGGKDREKNPDD